MMPSTALPLSMVRSRPSDRFRSRTSNKNPDQRSSLPHNEIKNSPKEWHSSFFRRNTFTEWPFVNAWQKINAVGDVLDIFLRGSGTHYHTWVSDVVKRFCLENHPTGETAQDKSARAWLDDRNVRTGHNRTYPKWQNAQKLRSTLEKPVRKSIGIVFGADCSLAIQSVWRARRTQTSDVS
jgi:hypothetical protein